MNLEKTQTQSISQLQTNSMRIMFVDNDLDYLSMVEAAFSLEHTLACIENGAISALSKLQKTKYQFDAILTDLAMSDMDGITFTEQIRRNELIRRTPAIDVYWFTGFSYNPLDHNDPITEAANRLKVKKIFTKPYDILKIISEIETMTVSRNWSNSSRLL